MIWLSRFIKEHKWAVILLAAAVVLFVLFESLGFIKTVLLIVFAVAAGFIGMLLDKGGIGAVKDFFKKVFSGKR